MKNTFFCGLLLCLGMAITTQVAQSDEKPNTGIAIYGVEKSSGYTMLAILDVPIGKFSVEQENLEPLSYQVIARGVTDPSQGANNSVIYWRSNKLWRYMNQCSGKNLGAVLPRSEREIRLFGIKSNSALGLSWI